MTRAVVTGGAGFLGSHLCERLLGEDWEVVCLDSFLTGSRGNLARIEDNSAFTFVEHDVTTPPEIEGHVDYVLHFASPASPKDYFGHPLETLKVGSVGTTNMLELAKEKQATFMLASTSEVYGDPLVHPQPESYWGNVNPVGPRSVYDEAKRYAEAVASSYRREFDLPVKINRIFNTYGPFMRRQDGRAVPNFIDQALADEPMTVHGDGTQTRSLCYVDDLIEGIFRFLTSDLEGVTNIGNPNESTVLEIAEAIRDLVGADSDIVFVERPVDDPEQRRPDISRARDGFGWEPKVAMEDGLGRTIEWAKEVWTR